IGLGRDAFLYVSDFFEDNDEYDKIVTAAEEKVLKLDRVPAPAAAAPPAPVETPAAEPPASEVLSARPVDVVTAKPEAGAPPLPPPASAMVGPAGGDRERRDGRRDERGGRGGRRSRRGRGGRGGDRDNRGGRGLPESKFYSPRQEESRAETATAEADTVEVVP